MKASTTWGDSADRPRVRWLRGALIGALWLGVWQLGYLAVDAELILPGPVEVANRLVTLVAEPAFLRSVLWSVGRVLAGLLLSTGLGVVLGIAAGFVRPLASLLSPMMLVIRSTPIVSFILLVILWVRSDWVPVLICVVTCLPIIWGNVYEGLTQVDARLVEMARLYDVPQGTVVRQIYLKSIAPFLNAALVTCMGFGFKSTVTAEVLSSPPYSIGYRLFASKVYLDSAEAWAWTIVILLLSLLFDVWFKAFLNRRRHLMQVRT